MRLFGENMNNTRGRLLQLFAPTVLCFFLTLPVVAQSTPCFTEVDSSTGGAIGTAGRMALADFNRDGILDIVQTHVYNNRKVSTDLGVGDGHLQLDFQYSTNLPRDVVSGDFNNDGIPDVAVAAEVPGLNAGKVWVLLGNGDGTLRPTANIQLPYNGERIKAADFNGDGKLDVVIQAANFSPPDTVQVLLGNGDGTLQAPTVIDNQPGYPQALAVGDLNGDGKMDVLTLSQSSSDEFLSVLLGNGDGTFAPAVEYLPTNGNNDQLALADFNEDGLMDVAFGGFDATIMYGTGGGALGPSVDLGVEASAVVAMDVLNSGHKDLVVLTSVGTQGRQSALGVLINDGHGNFAPVVNIKTHFRAPLNLYAGDFNGDGSGDVAAEYLEQAADNGVFLNCSNSK